MLTRLPGGRCSLADIFAWIFAENKARAGVGGWREKRNGTGPKREVLHQQLIQSMSEARLRHKCLHTRFVI